MVSYTNQKSFLTLDITGIVTEYHFKKTAVTIIFNYFLDDFHLKYNTNRTTFKIPYEKLDEKVVNVFCNIKSQSRLRKLYGQQTKSRPS